jgi:hypothetical protein
VGRIDADGITGPVLREPGETRLAGPRRIGELSLDAVHRPLHHEDVTVQEPDFGVYLGVKVVTLLQTILILTCVKKAPAGLHLALASTEGLWFVRRGRQGSVYALALGPKKATG